VVLVLRVGQGLLLAQRVRQTKGTMAVMATRMVVVLSRRMRLTTSLVAVVVQVLWEVLQQHRVPVSAATGGLG